MASHQSVVLGECLAYSYMCVSHTTCKSLWNHKLTQYHVYSTDTPAGPDDRISSLVGPHQFTTGDNHLVSITVSRGDYHSLMKRLVTELEAAGAHVANSNQKEMITKYVSSFSTGSVVDHEDASRYWIKDKGPVVET